MGSIFYPGKFRLGELLATPGAIAALREAKEDEVTYLKRHASGDWGELDEDDWEENEMSLQNDFRLLSAYTLSTGTKLWIITKADRSATTILLPEEY